MAFLDRWEEEINEFVKKYYQSFFTKNKFEFLKKEAAQGGGSMTFSDSAVLLQITNNKSRFMIQVGHMEGKSFWGLDLIKAHFKIADYRIDEDNVAGRKGAFGGFNLDDYAGNANFLVSNFIKVENLFAPANSAGTNQQMEKLSQEKQKYM